MQDSTSSPSTWSCWVEHQQNVTHLRPALRKQSLHKEGMTQTPPHSWQTGLGQPAKPQHSTAACFSPALLCKGKPTPCRDDSPIDFEVETSCLTPSHSTALAKLLRGSTARFEPLLKPKETCGTADTDHSLPGAPRTELTQHYHIRYPHVCQGEQLLLPKLVTRDPRTYQPLVNKLSCNAGG